MYSNDLMTLFKNTKGEIKREKPVWMLVANRIDPIK